MPSQSLPSLSPSIRWKSKPHVSIMRANMIILVACVCLVRSFAVSAWSFSSPVPPSPQSQSVAAGRVTKLASTPKKNNIHNFIYVTPPSGSKDWKQIGSLLVKVFDKEGGDGESATLLQRAAWLILLQFLTERDVMDQYMATSLKMKGNKYAILLAKRFVRNRNDVGSNENESSGTRTVSNTNNVVGMMELGMSCHAGNTDGDGGSKDGDGDDDVLIGATLGVLGILDSHQGMGIGTLLLQKCEALVTSEAWGHQPILYAEVEPNNEGALRFFEKHGFVKEGRIVPVKVRRKRIYEERPHYLLYKHLTTMTSSDTRPAGATAAAGTSPADVVGVGASTGVATATISSSSTTATSVAAKINTISNNREKEAATSKPNTWVWEN